MTSISLRLALSQAKALLVHNKAAFALYLGIGVLVPYILHAAEPSLSLRALVAVSAGGGFFSGSLTGPLYLFAIISILWTAAQFALWNAILVDLRDGPVGEIMFGLVGGLGFLFCNIVIAVLVALIPNLVLAFALTPIAMASPQAAVAVSVLQGLLGAVISIIIATRVILVGPIMAASGSMNPFPAFAESWRRTAVARGKLFLVIFVIHLLSGLVVAGLLAGHVAIIFNDPLAKGYGETAMATVWLLFWFLAFLLQNLLAAGLFRASSEGEAADVFA